MSRSIRKHPPKACGAPEARHHLVVVPGRQASPIGQINNQLDVLLLRLVEAQTTDELIEVDDLAEVLRVLAQRARLGLRAQNYCACIRLRAERRIGQMLDEMERAQVGRPKKNDSPENHFPRLKDLGITSGFAHRCRRLAQIPQWEFDGLLQRAIDLEWEISAKWVLRMADDRRRQEQNAQPQVGGAIEDLHEFIASGPKVGCIYLDPAWPVDETVISDRMHRPPLPYRTMSQEELRELPIGELAAPRCHLHLWTLAGRRFRTMAYDLIEFWGFHTVSELVWVKPPSRHPGIPGVIPYGNGKFWRMAHEVLLTAVRQPWTDQFDHHGLPSWLEAPLGAHSEKPDEVRRLIELASPGPRIELFSRREVEGWHSWGHEIPTRLIRSVKSKDKSADPPRVSR